MSVDYAGIIARITLDHYPTHGMHTNGPDVECQCGYSTSSENPPQNSLLGPGLGGRDRLNYHRARLVAQALVDGGLVG